MFAAMAFDHGRQLGASSLNAASDTVLITFSGLDGAGKSTLIAYLQQELAQARCHAVVYHMNRQVGLYAYLRLLRDLFAASPNPAPSEWQALRERETRQTGQPRRSPQRVRARLVALRNAVVWNRWLRGLLYPVDLVVFLCYRVYVERVRRHVLIMDRYFYDTLVDVADGRRWLWIRLLERITPTPDVAVYIEVEPEVAFARKGEYTIEYLRRRHERYRTVFAWIRSRLTLGAGDLGAMQAALRKTVLARLAPE
jgi:thymidylate kinase